jgi:hypothetical protein
LVGPSAAEHPLPDQAIAGTRPSGHQTPELLLVMSSMLLGLRELGELGELQ